MEAANDNDDLHPAGDCPSSHGSSQPFAYLIGIHLAAACIQIQQRSRLTGKVAPVGLPRLTGKRKMWMKDAVHADMDLARDAVEKTYSREFQGPNEDFSGTHDDALVTDNFSSITTSHAQEGLTGSGVPSSSLGQASEKTEAQSCTDLTMPTLHSSERQEKTPYISEEMTSEKQIQRAFLQRSLSEQCSLKNQFEGEQNGESSTCSSATFPGRACSSCDDVDVYDNDVTVQAIQEIIVMNKLPNDSQSTKILPNDRFSANLFESRSGPEVMRRSRSVGLELSTPDDHHYETPRNNVHNKDTTYLTKDDLRISDENNTSKTLDFGNELTDRGSQHGQIESLLLWPIGITIQTIAFQIRLIVQVFSLGVRLFSWCNSFASSRVRETMQAKERATEAFSQKVAMISDVRPKVTESGSVVLKRAGWGCVAVLYVCILLGVLLLPTLFLDYVFMSKIVEEPVSFKEPLHFDYTLPHPAAVLSLNSLKSKGISHPERVRPIPVGHKVQVTVFLTLPESDYNRDLGMFQLTAEILSESGQITKSSSRPCILRFHSLPIRMLKTFLIILPSLLGMFTESQTLAIHLMEFQEQHVMTSTVKILVQPKAGMPLGRGIPEIYSANVHIVSHLPWLKDKMHNWKWTVYIWTGLLLYVLEIIMILCCCRRALMPKGWIGQTNDVKPDQAGGNPSTLRNNRGHFNNQVRKEEKPVWRRAELHRRGQKSEQAGNIAI